MKHRFFLLDFIVSEYNLNVKPCKFALPYPQRKAMLITDKQNRCLPYLLQISELFVF